MVGGCVEPGFEPVASALADQLAAEDGGAAVCVYHRGRPVVDLWGGLADLETGAPWRADSLAYSFSTTKGVVATALHVCVERGLLDYDDRVAAHWPRFASHGKEAITVRQVLCHEAGLYDVMTLLGGDARRLLDWEYMVDALADAIPAIAPGSAVVYHALTFGYLVGELVRRVTGVPVAEVVRAELAEPLGLDGCFVPLEPSEAGRAVALIPPAAAEQPEKALEALEAGSVPVGTGVELHPEMMSAALGNRAVQAVLTDRSTWSAPIPATHGFFTARSLARLYAALAGGGELCGVRLLSPATLERATETQSDRPDKVTVFRMFWRLGYHRVFTTLGGVRSAFGHNGFGGSGAWADPARQLAVAMTLNRLSGMLSLDNRFMEVGSAAIRCADSAA